jgi:hypothetical protein
MTVGLSCLQAASGPEPLAGKNTAFSMEVEVTPGVSLGSLGGVNPDFSKEVEVQTSPATGPGPAGTGVTPATPNATPVVLSSPVVGLKVPLQVSLGEEKPAVSGGSSGVDFSGLVKGADRGVASGENLPAGKSPQVPQVPGAQAAESQGSGSGLLLSPEGKVLEGGLDSMMDYMVDKAPVAVAVSKDQREGSGQPAPSSGDLAVDSGRKLMETLGAPSAGAGVSPASGAAPAPGMLPAVASGGGDILPPVVPMPPMSPVGVGSPDLTALGASSYAGFMPPAPAQGGILPPTSTLAVGQLW